ncbi:MAG: RNA methyltransferase [Oscillospiraceae bacterium]|nr:RNA methyltransferase [Oscillospiraceae bacterium]
MISDGRKRIEKITSRKNPLVRHLKQLGASREYRLSHGELLCAGIRCLRDAATRARITAICALEPIALPELASLPQTLVTPDVLEYISPLKSPPGVLFSCEIPRYDAKIDPRGRYIILDGVQDPGNVGAVIRSAAAFGIDAVLLHGACADPFNPKTVRAAMGALFWQRIIETDDMALTAAVNDGLVIYGAALSDAPRDVRSVDLSSASVAVGSEGAGLSERILSLCRERVIIPMQPGTQSLNAAVSAGILLWEMYKG